MRIVYILIMCLVMFGCSEETPVTDCQAINEEESSWFMNTRTSLTNCSCEISIIRARYLGQTVYYTALTDPLCNGVNTPTLVDCQGKTVRVFSLSDVDQQDFNANVVAREVLYRCKD